MLIGVEEAQVACPVTDKERILHADVPESAGAHEAMPVVVGVDPETTSTRRVAPRWLHGWPVPSSISFSPNEARGCICLPEFDPAILELARIIADGFPAADAAYRRRRHKEAQYLDPDVPRFERVFRLAVEGMGRGDILRSTDYDELLVLSAWLCVRPQEAGYLGSYPKSLLCPLSHTAPPIALESLTAVQRMVFDRRAPYYLRYLVCEKFGLRTCADLEQADLRRLLRSAGFRLIRPSAVPEAAFPGVTRGEDPPVRPWMLTLRQELTETRAGELLIQAALWQVQHGLQLVTVEGGVPRWNIGAFERTNWEDAFLSLGVRAPAPFTRTSGLLDWRKLLARCLDEVGIGNLPPAILSKVSAAPQRVSHDDGRAIWDVLDRAGRAVLEQVGELNPELFHADGALNYPVAREFRRWVRLFDEFSPNILSRFGVSAFTVLHRVAPESFGWGPTHLKPWELEQERGKWKGPRGHALLRSAYAFALSERGLGSVCIREDQVFWVCTEAEFSEWSREVIGPGATPYEFFYELASRHGLTPLLNREITHTAAVSLMAGVDLHQNLPRVEGCWDVCMRGALNHHGGTLEVRLSLPDLVPLPLRLRKAVMTPVKYGYLHKAIRLVRDFDLRMARESHRPLMELPGWWDDERIVGTPLLECSTDVSHPFHAVLRILRPEPWIESTDQRVRFQALHLLLSRRATVRSAAGEAGLASSEIRTVLEVALQGALPHTNIAQVTHPAIRRGLERLLARDDTRELLDSLLLHIGTAYETQVWRQARKFIVLDMINDLLMLTVRNSLLHVMSSE